MEKINNTIYLEDTEDIKKFLDTDMLHKKENSDIQDKIMEYKNIMRSKFQLQRIVKCNELEFYSFITLTFEENITDIKYANNEFKKWRTSVQRIKKDFKYVCVPEFQHRGAIHYHLLTNIKLDTNLIPKPEKPLKLWNKEEKRYKIVEYYNLKYWKNGFSSAYDMKNINVVGYLSKYMTKNIDNRLFGKQKYLTSQNLKRPRTIYINTKEKKDLIFLEKIKSTCEIKYTNSYYNTYDNFVVDFEEYKTIKN